jgi:hypothetical protein
MSQAPFYDKDGNYQGSVDTKALSGACKHPKVKDVGSCYEGCCDKYECLDCSLRFTVECPD